MEVKGFVYIHINKINGKKYIGQTIQSPIKRWDCGRGYNGCSRFFNAIKKYGWDNFEHKVFECNESDLDRIESELIAQYNTTNPQYGYNLEYGGHLNKHLSNDTKQKISQKLIGHKYHPTRNIVQLTLEGELIKEYNSIKEAQMETGSNHIFECCNRKRTQSKGYIWLYKEDYEYMVKQGNIITTKKRQYNIPVLQYSLDGEFIAEYNSISDAERKLGNNHTHIWDVCNGKRKKANGFIWKYKTSS